MAFWLMKTAPGTYREWSTGCDEWASGPMTREEAIAEHGEDRVEFTDKHLCSCRARLGESTELRNGRLISRGTGPLAYHFDTFEQVAEFCTR